mmetsp:Transcript_124946/g.233661  ORF Transcript_124946/g.233661 Transcript_124946/m.233661 type:complete len:202 (-) Transcript_124946:61-666(-)
MSDKKPSPTNMVEKVRQSHCTAANFVWFAHRLLRFLGVTASLSFGLLGCWFFLHPPEWEDFFAFCRWCSDAFLGVIAAFLGCYLEAKGHAHGSHFWKFALNRWGAGFFYAWLGLCAMGDVDRFSGAWKGIAHAVGVISWMVTLGNLMISWSGEQVDRDKVAANKAHDAKDIERATGEPMEEPSLVPPGGWSSAATNVFGAP